ncbi:MAG: peptidase S8 [Bacteroidetes bacterium]|nr:peptidase S8 [Bacteroidota bacterium]
MKYNFVKRFVLLGLWAFASLVPAFSQSSGSIDSLKGWHLAAASSGFQGIALEQAYQWLKDNKKKSTTIIVAVIDSGIDTLHEDLKSVLWKNAKEIPGNSKDDDSNGYIDDVYGWNFLGNRAGENVEKDSYEAARVYHGLREKWEGKSIEVKTLSSEEKFEYEMWNRAKEEMAGNDNGMEIIYLKRAYQNFVSNDSLLRIAMGKEKYTGNELGAFNPETAELKRAKSMIYGLLSGNDMLDVYNTDFLKDFKSYVESEESKADAALFPPTPYRNQVVKDEYQNIKDRSYGNGNIMVGLDAAVHGTHVSGIIGAARKNGVGMDGVADNVQLMTLRAVPDGDEHDKDIALAIRYAVDHGARVINMSFGKSFSPQKIWVDEAVRYAASKDVLLIHAAGNDAKNLDSSFNYPTPQLLDGSRPNNWITVGASGDPQLGGLTANFSNYGKNEVDVFAPGVKIWSTVPGTNTYQFLQGTSMAAPVVAGLAALIMEYFPTLSAAQVKEVIEKSAQKPKETVKDPGSGDEVLLSELSRTGGIINAYEAVKLASTMKGDRVKNPVKTKKSF